MASWGGRALLSAIIVFFFTYGGLASSWTVDVNAHNPNVWFAGSLIYITILLVD